MKPLVNLSADDHAFIAKLVGQGFGSRRISGVFAEKGRTVPSSTIACCKAYRKALHAAEAQAQAALASAPKVRLDAVFPKYTRMVLPVSTTWTQHFNEPVRVPVSVRALSWDLPA